MCGMYAHGLGLKKMRWGTENLGVYDKSHQILATNRKLIALNE